MWGLKPIDHAIGYAINDTTYDDDDVYIMNKSIPGIAYIMTSSILGIYYIMTSSISIIDYIMSCNTPYLITCISHCYMCWSICIDPKLGIYEFKYEYWLFWDGFKCIVWLYVYRNRPYLYRNLPVDGSIRRLLNKLSNDIKISKNG